MSKFPLVRAVLLSCAVASMVPIALAAQQGELAIAPNVFASCQYRFMAIFPETPKARDITYTIGGMTVPARQFYVDQGTNKYSVTVADFSNGGPAVDEEIVEDAATAIRLRGEVKFQFPEDYTPGIPGRQLNVFDPNGHQHRASIYMVDHRLVLTESYADPNDFTTIQFEQSIGMLDGTGRDLNNVASKSRYACDNKEVSVQTAGDLVKDAVAAQGGADALRRLTGITAKGDAKFWEPNQSEIAGGDARPLGTATVEVTWDLAKGMARTRWDRDQQYPPPAAKMSYTETVLPTLGFVTTGANNQPMSGIRTATHLRELERASPRLLLKAMDNPANVRGVMPQRLNNRYLSTVAITEGETTFFVLFDPTTRLPAAIRTRDDDNIYGDSDYDLIPGDWTNVGGARVPRSLSYRINDIEVLRIDYSTITPTANLPADAFTVPAAVQSAAKQPATANVPYQWVLRRLFLTRLTDSDAIIYPDGGALKLVELAPNVQHVQGGTANNLIVAMKNYLIVFDAPYGELQSRWVINAAKAKYPGKPIKYLVLTHHHMDHTGGMRTFVAEGATLLVPSRSVEFFEKAVRVPHTIVPDELQKNPRPANIYGIFENQTIRDETGEVRLYEIKTGPETAPRPGSSHSDGMLIGHVVNQKLIYVTDLISPRGVPIDRSENTLAVGGALEEFEVEKDVTIVGGHGTTVKRADIETALFE
jgi:glyoxylase-like metal-dependent hydrolase (beta-lactamase superfamily II)